MLGFQWHFAFAVAALIEGRVESSMGTLGEAMDFGSLVLANNWHCAGKLVGLLRTGLGWLVVLGSC